MQITGPRSQAQITFSTWKALFLRTAVARMSASRFAWFWLLFEPIAFVVMLVLIFTYLRVRQIGGISIAVWVTAGVLSFYFFRRAAVQGMNALTGSKSLFSYSQIRPVDPVIAIAALEGFMMILISILFMSGASAMGLGVWPDNALAVVEAALGLWLLGLGYGLITSVLLELVPAAGATLSFISQRPLYFISGVLFPIALVPFPYKDWLLLNPIVHGVEAARLGFAPYYHVPSQVSIGYLYQWAIGLVFFGLALHVRYSVRLARGK